MMPFRRILFPTDFSAATAAMAPYVKEMAQRFSASVTVLNALDLAPNYALSPSLTAGDGELLEIPYIPVFQEVRKLREQRLEEFSQAHLSGVTWTSRIEDGDPAIVIEWVAREEGTDLIMMPSKGHGRFRRLILGSITAKVLHDVSCSVLTSAHEPDPARASSPRGYTSIICAVELNPEAHVVLGVAGRLAKEYGASLCLLSIGPSLREPEGKPLAESLKQAFEEAMNDASGDRSAGTAVRTLDAPVPEGIRRTAIEVAADLVVVGRGLQIGILSQMWSHLYTIIRESPCQVLSV